MAVFYNTKQRICLNMFAVRIRNRTQEHTMTKTFMIILMPLSLLFVLAGCHTFKGKNSNLENKNMEANVMYEKLTPNMMVENVNSTVTYYRNVLGFEFVIGVPEKSQDIVSELKDDQKLCFAIMKYNKVEIMFQTQKSLSEEIPEYGTMSIGGSIAFYIDVNDVKQLYENLKDKVTITSPIATKFYGKEEFYIRDCNGYVLGFAGAI